MLKNWGRVVKRTFGSGWWVVVTGHSVLVMKRSGDHSENR